MIVRGRVSMSPHLKPLEELKIQHRSIRHIRERVIPKERTADVIEPPTKVRERRRMHEVV
jgi:hypothetical protein